METVKRVVIVGPGAAGKSTLAANLGEITGLPVIELDKLFWRPGLVATPRDRWAAIQHELVTQDLWIMDGLGPYDVIDVRLRAADTIVFLDFSSVRCAWRAIRRSRERADFWRWLWTIAARVGHRSCRRSPPTPQAPTSTYFQPHARSHGSSPRPPARRRTRHEETGQPSI